MPRFVSNRSEILPGGSKLSATQFIFSFLIFVLFSYPAYPQRGKQIVLEGATIIDGWNNVPITNGYIVIKGTKIANMGKRYEVVIPPDAEIINLKGKFIVPGFIDVYSLYQTEEDYAAMFSLGITTANITAASFDTSLLQQSKNDSTPLPEIFPSLSVAMSTQQQLTGGENGKEIVAGDIVLSASNARDFFQSLRSKGLNSASLVYTGIPWCNDSLPQLEQIEKSTTVALLKEAKQSKIFTAAQAPNQQAAQLLLDAGASALLHGILDERISSDAVSQMGLNPTYYVPTLTLFESYIDAEGILRQVVSDTLWKTIIPTTTLQKYSSPEYLSSFRGLCPTLSFGTSDLQIVYDNTAAIIKNYVPIPVGTGAPFLPGVTYHLELEHLVKAGLTPMQAIVSAGAISAEYLGIRKQTGFLYVMYQADMLVLDKNPLEDIRNTRSISMIIKNGVIFDAKKLQQQQLK